MKTAVLLFVILLSLFAAVPPAPVHAASSGCASVGFTVTNGAASSPPSPMHFDAGDKIVYIATATGGLQFRGMSIFDLTHGVTNVARTNPGGPSGMLNYTIPTSGNYQFFFDWLLVSGGAGTVTETVSCVSAQGGGGGSVVPLFADGRLNKDAAQTAAIYCEQGGVTVYAVVDSVGYLAFKVTKVELAAVPAKPAKNMLIKSGHGVSLYRLTSGELQINAPDNYVFIWNGCPAA